MNTLKIPWHLLSLCVIFFIPAVKQFKGIAMKSHPDKFFTVLVIFSVVLSIATILLAAVYGLLLKLLPPFAWYVYLWPVYLLLGAWVLHLIAQRRTE